MWETQLLLPADALNPKQRAFVHEACKGLLHQVAHKVALNARTLVPVIPDSKTSTT